MKKKNKKYRIKQRFSLTLLLSFVVFVVLIVASLVALICVNILVKYNIIDTSVADLALDDAIWFMVLMSVLIGTSVTLLIGKIPLRPINKVIDKINSLASGNYQTRLDFSPSVNNIPAFRELSVSFNKLAEELSNTEMLSSDFINNFSHEFKTPIVSIAGFAKLLKRGNLTEEQREQYLNAIEEESLRLSYMATNVLNLTKIENQSILTNVTKYNLSEQIRSCILLLDERWMKKDIELQLDLDEHIIEANEEMMKHAIINLLDNAIKFANDGGTVSVSIKEKEDDYFISIGNTGSEISPEHREKIWQKFYQADESHASEGNGVGLAMVKKIVALHHGSVSFECAEGTTVFTIRVNKKCEENSDV